MKFSRRSLIKSAPAAALVTASLGSAPFTFAQTVGHRVVVVGGGFAGATAARYLARWGGDSVDVTIVDPNPAHTSCVMSNLILNGQLSKSDLSFDLTALEFKYGIHYVQGYAEAIEPGELVLASGDRLAYDSLIVSGGVAFDTAFYGPDYDPEVTPHAWIAGAQTELLAQQLAAIGPTDTVILGIPKAPYRCPPGPYERACVMANIVGKAHGTLGTNTTGPRVVVLDGNPDIIVEKETFARAFSELYGNIIEYYPSSEVTAVDSANGVVTAGGSTYQGKVVNIIPKHQATPFVINSGLTDGGLWAPVNPISYESTVAGFENVYVIGDAQATGQPKSGHMANSQAKICADAVLRKLQGQSLDDPARLGVIVTNSACFSPVSDTEASWLSAVYQYDQAAGSMVTASVGASSGWSSRNYNRMYGWANNLLADTFL